MCFLSGKSQILDDSTHLIYGFHSTKYYTDDYFFEDSILLETVDSSFVDKHEYDNYFKNGSFSQHLGNSISPTKSLHFNPYSNVLQNLAVDRYSVFRFSDKKYYNTKSPYTFLKYIQGSAGDQILEGMYTQNIKNNWNVGSEFYRGVSKKQYATTQGGDKLASVWSVRAFTSYLSNDKRYHLLGDLETQNSKTNEQWGIVFDDVKSDSVINETIDRAEFAEDNWNSGNNEQKYRSISLKHRYDIVKGYAGVYSKHKFRRDKRMYFDEETNVFYEVISDTLEGDTLPTLDTITIIPEFYRNIYYSSDSTYDEKTFDSFENEVGVYFKRDLWHLEIGYLQQSFGYENNYQSAKVYGLNNALKGEFAYRYEDKFNFKFKTINSASGAFNSKAELNTDYGSLSYNKILSRPYLQDNYLNSNHLRWQNNFKFINTDEYRIKLHYTYKNISMETDNKYLNINNQIYYDSLYQPNQYSGTINIFQSNNKIKFKLGNWYLEQNTLYTSKNVNFIQIPEFTTQSRMYWLGVLGDGVINTQLGVDLNWRSNFYANSYSPIIQDFYVQSDIKNFAYPIFDVFANFNINNVDFFLKAGHVNQTFGRPGYLVSAYYPSKRFYFSFGVNWRFFD